MKVNIFSGEPFAEQPYALAVQQGSQLQEQLSRVILELQKDRYFETLQSKYWNTSKKNNCPILDDSEGTVISFPNIDIIFEKLFTISCSS